MTTRSCALCVVAVLLSGRAHAQTIPTQILNTAAEKYPQPFSHVQGVREQSDGRVLVLDDQENKILRVNLKNKSATPVSRTGQGPGEYTLPLNLVALPGDTTIAMDMVGGGKHIVITRDSVAGTALRVKGFENNKPIVANYAIGADARGRLYEMVSRSRVEKGRRIRTDSEGIRRLDRGTGKQDTLGSLSRLLRSELFKPPSSSTGKSAADDAAPVRGGSEPPPFSSVDQWAVAPDGRIAVVSVFPYRVTFFGEDGKRTEGAVIPYAPVKVTAKIKDQWRELKQQPVPSLSYRDGKFSAGHFKPKLVEPQAWPRELPPLLDDAVHFALDGMLWVERTTGGGGQTFDVIDRAGRVTSRVVMPLHARLVGFGNGAVYIVRIGDDDLELLERHVLK